MVRVMALAGLVGCGGDEVSADGAFPRACDESTIDGDCVEYTGDGWVAADVTDNCDGGAIVPECPPTTPVGECALDAGTEFETITVFYTPFWNAASGVQACAGQGGAWTAATR
ncbi:MAG: hypothetical protein ABMA64_40960 [Myxococcota bacterium]